MGNISKEVTELRRDLQLFTSLPSAIKEISGGSEEVQILSRDDGSSPAEAPEKEEETDKDPPKVRDDTEAIEATKTDEEPEPVTELSDQEAEDSLSLENH